jgi:polysaccharide deacetylase family protein (PEP-CTERM system associated)
MRVESLPLGATPYGPPLSLHGPLHHHFTVDVEEYFQVSAMEPYLPRDQWAAMPSRVALGVKVILDLLAEHRAYGTFFVLGWVAERCPALVREISDAGHEIASHGWGHERITQMSRAAFRDSVRRSKSVLEAITDRPVLGYRAPSFSIVRGGEWALDVLLEEGYRYDSSLYPVRRAGYGFAGGERHPHVLRRLTGTLREFPPATLQWGRTVLPAGGGAYFRHLPYALVATALRESEVRRVPATFYIHPWEVDPDQPRLPVPWRTRVRHYGGLRRTVPRLRRLLGDFRFRAIAHTLSLEERALEARSRVRVRSC